MFNLVNGKCNTKHVKRLSLLLITSSFIGMTLFSQNVSDAIRFTTTDVIGTARNMSVGSSMNALGADFGVLSQNPAGLGAFRWSEFVATPAVPFSKYTSKLTNDSNSEVEQMSSFNFANFGLVLVNKPRGSKWKTSNFGIGVNQIANFNNSFYFDGSTPGSITYRFIDIANGLAPEQLDEFEALPAYITGAIYDFEEDFNYENDFMEAGDVDVPKRQDVTSEGGINELVISLAGNYDEKLMLGASIGVSFFNYEVNKAYTEDDDQDLVPFFDFLEFTEFLSTTGTGINVKLGAILNITKQFRWGLSFHTPTVYKFEDNFATTLAYQFTDDGTQNYFDEESPNGNFDYRYRTPLRASTSLGFIVRKFGFISAAVEWIPYQSGEFRFDSDLAYQDELNSEIFNNLRNVFNIKVGGELALSRFRVRAGIQLNTSPFFDEDKIDQSYSAGLGYRADKFFVDVGYRIFNRDDSYSPYSLPQSLGYTVDVEQKLNTQFLTATIGFKF